MKIAFIITSLEIGGAEKVVTSLADALAQHGHEVLIAYLTGNATVRPVNPDIRIIDIGVTSNRDLFSAYFKLRRLLVDFKPDIVNSHLVHSNILARLLRLTTPIPRLITSVHNTYDGGPLRMLAYRLTDHLADISTNVSDEAVAAFVMKKAVKTGRMITVHNGISTSEFCFSPSARSEIREQLGISDNCKLIVAVGRLNQQKDYPNLFRALTKLDANQTDYKVCIAGDGPLKDELQVMIGDLTMAGHVEFLGIRRDVAKLLSAADVFVLSSAWEGFSLVVAEAMACERVVVATDCGGVSEVVGSAGYLVPPRQPVALADALRAALALSPAETAALGKAARERVQNCYSLDAAVRKWSALYSGPVLN